MGLHIMLTLLSTALTAWAIPLTSRPLSDFINHFEILDYDVHELHSRHQRSVNSGQQRKDHPVFFTLLAFNRSHVLRLTPDDVTFDPSADLKSGKEIIDLDISHLYHGYVIGDPKSRVHGSIIDGLFQGKVQLSDGEVLYIERKEKYKRHVELQRDTYAHSVVYREKDVQNINTFHKDLHGYCGNAKLYNMHWMADFLKKRQRRDTHDQEEKDVPQSEDSHISYNKSTSTNSHPSMSESLENMRIAGIQSAAQIAEDPRLTCSVQMIGGPVLWNHYKPIVKTDRRTRMEITGLFQFLIRELNGLIEAETFVSSTGIGYTGLNARISRVLINSSEDCLSAQTRHPFCGIGIDESNLLSLLSDQKGHHEYCHSHLITVRDFSEGTVGLAWVGKPLSNPGICGTKAEHDISLNTALTTLLNFGEIMPGALVRLVFAHEFGHNAGCEHDDKNSMECAPKSSGAPNAEDGNYIMFPAAQDGYSINNRRWSPCSNRAVAALIEGRKSKGDICFTERTFGFCGNSIIDENEECDCGFLSDCQDGEPCCPCCVGRDEVKTDNACKLKPGVSCDPAQGPCCTQSCDFDTTEKICRVETECASSAFCSTNSSECPPGTPKADDMPCNSDTQICSDGECIGSICQLIASESGKWSACVASVEMVVGFPCYVACKEENSDTCWSSTASNQADFPPPFKQLLSSLNSESIKLPAGSPCDDYKGFCDVFQKCRMLYSLGPIARLATQFFSKSTLQIILENLRGYWYLAAGGLVALLLLTAAFIKICAVHTPTSNPHYNKIDRENEQIQSLVRKKNKIVNKMMVEMKAEVKRENAALKEVQDKEKMILTAIDSIVNDLIQKGGLKVANLPSTSVYQETQKSSEESTEGTVESAYGIQPPSSATEGELLLRSKQLRPYKTAS